MSRKLSYDSYLFGAAMLIIVVGLVMIYSASAMITTQKVGAESPYYFLTRQCVWLLAGGAVMLTLMHIDPSRLRDRRVLAALMFGVLAALVIAMFQPAINGRHRWIVLPMFQVQPSEFAKPVLILFLAAFLAQREDRINEVTATLLPLGAVLALFGGLIVLEDFGTATTIILVAVGMIFAAGIAWNRMAIFAMMLVPAAAMLVFNTAYRRDRLFTFLNPDADPLGKGFQAMQSLIAVGTGGLRGLGIGNGRQKLFFLPEPHTDFIFSIIGEELGMWVTLAVVLSFLVLVLCSGWITIHAPEPAGVLLGIGITVMVALQALMNLAVVTSLMPCKGIPLPFISYGGSNLLTCLAAVGMLFNMHRQGIYHVQSTPVLVPQSYSVRM